LGEKRLQFICINAVRCWGYFREPACDQLQQSVKRNLWINKQAKQVLARWALPWWHMCLFVRLYYSPMGRGMVDWWIKTNFT